MPGAGAGAAGGSGVVSRTGGTEPARGPGGTWLIACSASAVLVSEGFTPARGGREIARPETAEPVPVILTYSPYNSLSEGTTPNLANDGLGERYAGTRITVHHGTRGSQLVLPVAQ